MAKKQKFRDITGIVFSTDPEFNYEEEPQEGYEDIQPGEQLLRIWIDRKHRGGKVATLIKGYVGTEDTLKDLTKSLKQHCGVGGTCKDGEIIIQGDQRNKVMAWLIKKGYVQTKMAGS